MWGLKMPAGAAIPAGTVFAKRRRVWDDWIGAAQSRERRAYGFAIGSLALAGFALWGWHDFSLRRPFQVVVVERDALGRVIRNDNAGTTPLTQEQVAKRFRNWVYHARSVLVDATAIRSNITEAYAAVKAGSPANTALIAFHQGADPMERAARETLYVYRQVAQPTGGNTWQVEWCESRAARDGTPLSIEAWRMTATWTHEAPDTPDKAQVNPDGWYVTAFDWRRITDGRQAAVQPTPGSNAAMMVPVACQ